MGTALIKEPLYYHIVFFIREAPPYTLVAYRRPLSQHAPKCAGKSLPVTIGRSGAAKPVTPLGPLWATPLGEAPGPDR